MALTYECSDCLHVQHVAVLDNGLLGFANPDAACEGCGAKGTFHHYPGWQAHVLGQLEKAREALAEALRASHQSSARDNVDRLNPDTPEGRVYKALLGLQVDFQEAGDEAAEDFLCDNILDPLYEKYRDRLPA